MRTPNMSFALLAVLLQTTGVFAADWHVTKYVVKTTTVSTNTRYTYAYTYADTLTVKPGITPSATPVSTRTSTYSYVDVGVVEYDYLYLPSNAVASSDLIDEYAYTTATGTASTATTTYLSPVVYTAPASCPTPFTFSTYTSVYIPSDIQSQIHPASTTTSKGYYSVYTTAYLSASALPTLLDPTDDYYYRIYIAECSNPATYTSKPATYTSSSGGGSTSSTTSHYNDGDNGYVYCRRSVFFCTSLNNWIIILATVIPGLFVLGFFESFFWFRRLMLGKGCLRLGTISWILISLWVICITRKQEGKTSKEDRETLGRMWKTYPISQKLKLWFKWGFRHQYPVDLLGPAPGPSVEGVKHMSVEEWMAQRQQGQVPAHPEMTGPPTAPVAAPPQAVQPAPAAAPPDARGSDRV